MMILLKSAHFICNILSIFWYDQSG